MQLSFETGLTNYTVKQMVEDAPEHRVLPVVIEFYTKPETVIEHDTSSADCTVEGAIILWHHNTFKCIGDMIAIALWLQDQGITDIFDYKLSFLQ
jgi:hypothetical protein